MRMREKSGSHHPKDRARKLTVRKPFQPVQQLMLVISALRGQKQEYCHEFETSPG